MPADMKPMLARRGFVTGTGNVRWALFDQVGFAAWSPGQRIYDRVKRAHKDATRTDDIDALRAILKSCHADIGQILDKHTTGPAPTEASLAAARTGCRIIRNDFYTANSTIDRAIRQRFADVKVELGGYLESAPALPDSPQRAALLKLRSDIEAATALADKAAGEGAAGDTAREQALSAMLETYTRLLMPAAPKPSATAGKAASSCACCRRFSRGPMSAWC